jgi:nucleotide-binding universal stress UspA family protein
MRGYIDMNRRFRPSVSIYIARVHMLRKGIVEAADEHNANLIVLGPHRRNGLLGHLQGSLAAAVVAHTPFQTSSSLSTTTSQ